MATLAVVTAEFLRFGGKSPRVAGYSSLDYPIVSIIIIVTWLWLLAVYRTRAPVVIGAGSEEFRRLWSATMTEFGAIAILSMLLKLDIARGYLAIALPLGVVGLTLNRRLARRVVVSLRRRGRMLNAVLAVGALQSVRGLVESVARHPEDGYTVVAACIPGRGGVDVTDVAELGDLPLYPDNGNFEEAIRASGAHTVAVTSTDHLGPCGFRDLSWQLEKLDVDLVVSPGMVDLAGPRLAVRSLARVPLIQIAKPRYDGAKGFQKRAFDLCFSLMVLAAALPVMLLAATAIKLTSKGQVFYTAERIGLNGEPFRMIKFRTMIADAEQRLTEVIHLNEGDGLLFKIQSDPRVTRVGRFLRHYSIDELPQFINVLRGEMSVVGPRPPLPAEVASYDDQIRRRLLVRPGITGLWQVSGRSALSWEDSVRLDLSYVDNWSMLADLAIALMTVRAVICGSGAY
ncbi:sugar transferase [Mycobacterium sp.]|uniref:sugar transferase n=1 Tax=Mycobacterium sp. TaxID=1785 RepID=UPI00333E3035